MEQNEEIETRILAVQLQQIQTDLEYLRGVMEQMDAAISHLDNRLALLESVHGRMPGKLAD